MLMIHITKFPKVLPCYVCDAMKYVIFISLTSVPKHDVSMYTQVGLL